MLTDKQKEIIDIVTGMVEEHFADEYSGHDFLHTKRVVRNAYELSESEGGDLFVIILAALVHDVDDKKLDVDRKGEFYYGRKILLSAGLDDKLTDVISDIVSSVSFSDGKECSSKEAMIVQDADRLDALGAVGIARCFAYGGNKKRQIYSLEDFEGNNMFSGTSSLSHFYTKLLKLENLMKTDTAKVYAHRRTAFMKLYLKEFYNEIGCEYVI